MIICVVDLFKTFSKFNRLYFLLIFCVIISDNKVIKCESSKEKGCFDTDSLLDEGLFS